MLGAVIFILAQGPEDEKNEDGKNRENKKDEENGQREL